MEPLLGSIPENRCVINLAAIRTNLALIRDRVGRKSRILAMIKAFAYGTDPIWMAKFLQSIGVEIFGVAHPDEAIALRKGGVKEPIFVIHASQNQLKKIVKWNLEVGIGDAHAITGLADAAAQASKCIKVHLHVDTGMGRLGCRPDEAVALAQEIVSSSHLSLEGVMTHLACADDPEHDAFTWGQIALFDQVIAKREKEKV